jgi:hypothetical protein
MTHKETVERNIGLTFDFVNHLIDNEQKTEKLPKNFNLRFIEKDFPKRESKQKEKRKSSLQEHYVHVKNSFVML